MCTHLNFGANHLGVSKRQEEFISFWRQANISTEDMKYFEYFYKYCPLFM